ncbi:hypothetical protein S101446_03480 (plasmid) [Komagataeibacter europaeus]|uniref:Uncharacterized protein n=1 Tax=Komagataeibacter intermedius AF2 TaxID=1458464 RepID=A0A0N0MDY7_9PROT|nr:hypothetical protein S101446_03480 [Komagataeibacter europaeus]KPH85843.1 hypothetical protein GLUCOINTEAF2_0203162 [Komagataeibacter intermedius AF2]
MMLISVSDDEEERVLRSLELMLAKETPNNFM